ncbi:hypothetical protein TNCV_2299391 [Trichonephila clavipes]|nr:hypothetical protein TNCV_2299391 [Trichonephila clavipes]
MTTHFIRNKLHSDFPIQKSHLNAGCLLERVTLRIRRKNGYQHALEFGSKRSAADREPGFSLHHITICIGLNSKTAMQIGSRWVHENHTESQILRSMIESYLRCLEDVNFQKDNIRLKAANRVLTYLDTEGVRMLSWPLSSPILSPIENIWPWVVDRLGRRCSQAITIDEMWARLEAT